MKRILIISFILIGTGLLYMYQNGYLGILSGDTPINYVQTFTQKDCDVITRDEYGVERLIQCITSMSDDFEHGIQLTTAKWHKIINQTSNGQAGNKDNAIQTTTEYAHSGNYSLKTFTTQDSGDLQKSALARELLFFPPGSDFWYSAWYYIPGGTNTSDLYLFELESTAYHYVGRRLALTGPSGNLLYVNAKQDTGNNFYQPSPAMPFPKDRWVNLKLHIHLSSGTDGLVELWQDNKKIIEGSGQNMPPSQFYNWISVGQTANASHQAQIVYIDDVIISDQPITN